MEEIKSILKVLDEFLAYKIWNGDKVDITAASFLTVIISLVVVNYALKLFHRLVTAKLPEEDKNKLICQNI